MRLTHKHKYHIIILLTLSFGLYGASNIHLTDIETAIIQKDYAAGKKLAQQFIEHNPSSEELKEALYYLGLSELRLGNLSQAREVFSGLINDPLEDSLRDKVYLGIIDSFSLEGQYKQARDTAEKLRRLNPKSEYLSLIYLKLARTNLKLAQWNKAKSYLEKIIHDFPDSLEIRRATQLLEEKQYFSVQVGAFLEQIRAEQFISELKQKGEYAYIIETTDYEGRKFFRVRIGRLSLLHKAEDLKSRLAQLGYPTQIYP